MDKNISLITSVIAKVLYIFFVPGLIMGTILMSTSLVVFINIPSLLFVILIICLGISFSFGFTFPFKTIVNTFVCNEDFTDKDFDLSIQLFNYAYTLSIGVGIIGSIISFIQIFINSENWQIADVFTVIALLPLFYGVVISILVVTPLKYALLRNYNRLKR